MVYLFSLVFVFVFPSFSTGQWEAISRCVLATLHDRLFVRSCGPPFVGKSQKLMKKNVLRKINPRNAGTGTGAPLR